jgi:benzoyl-CoA reductase/2-hydroxyglutaryl-CoA dehydratase subunit BcrC/BadD/HgdB
MRCAYFPTVTVTAGGNIVISLKTSTNKVWAHPKNVEKSYCKTNRSMSTT